MLYMWRCFVCKAQSMKMWAEDEVSARDQAGRAHDQEWHSGVPTVLRVRCPLPSKKEARDAR